MFVCLSVGIFTSTATGATDDKDSLQIYLPRQVRVGNETITLGQISVLRGPEALVAGAGDISLGRLHSAERELVLSKTMILARLSCSGIDASVVEMSGAEKIKVSSKRRVIDGDEFVEAAEAFLSKHYQGKTRYQFSPVKKPKDLSIPGDTGDVNFSANLPKACSNGCIKVRVAAVAGDEEIGVRFVDLKVQYPGREVIAQDDIPAGAIITRENTKIASVFSDRPQSPNWKAPYGLVARRNISAGSVINTGLVRQVRPEVLVKRNKHVAVVISKPGLAITAIGRALEDGHAGEYIKVQMRITDTSRTIIAKVNNDGTVEPVL